jgi:pimeloyl-ACP methyl ester carboxylesterase
VLFLAGSAFRGNHFSIPAAGYDGTAQAARRGMFAFTVDYLGVGASTKPADGRDAGFPQQIAAMRTVVDFIRHHRNVPRVDLLGEGYGGAIATQLAANPGRIRSVVMDAMLYDTLVGGPLTDPAFVEMLENDPDGYFFVPGEGSFVFMNGAPPEVFAYVGATQGGLYPTPNFLVAAYERPFFDPGVARVPGLVIFGPGDIVVGPNGVDGLVRDYGRRGASLVVLEEAGHAPRVESPATAARFWGAVFAFLERGPRS